MEQMVVGAICAVAAGAGARALGMLSSAGAVSAAIVGTAAAAAGWGWCAVILAFFVPSVALSRWRAAAKDQVAGPISGGAGPRNAWQVLANGGVCAMAAGASAAGWLPGIPWDAVGLGAIAASTADTWGTEVGTAIGGAPRSVRTLRPVPAGTSGAVTLAGTFASLAGGGWMGTVAWLAGFDPGVSLACGVAGVAGAFVDSGLGATIQLRRWCPSCQIHTERGVHHCGSRTMRHDGWPFMTNDAVNLTSTIAGALVAWWLVAA